MLIAFADPDERRKIWRRDLGGGSTTSVVLETERRWRLVGCPTGSPPDDHDRRWARRRIPPVLAVGCRTFSSSPAKGLGVTGVTGDGVVRLAGDTLSSPSIESSVLRRKREVARDLAVVTKLRIDDAESRRLGGAGLAFLNPISASWPA
jgi:hypothetical protein